MSEQFAHERLSARGSASAVDERCVPATICRGEGAGLRLGSLRLASDRPALVRALCGSDAAGGTAMNALPSDVKRGDEQPGLAIVANVPTPYRVHLHRRLALGIPELKLHSLFTHRNNEFQWQMSFPPEIHAADFAVQGEPPSSWRPWFDWRKGKALIRHLRSHNVAPSSAWATTHDQCSGYGRCAATASPSSSAPDSNIRNEVNVPRLAAVAQASGRGLGGAGSVPASAHRHLLPTILRVPDGADPARCLWVPFEPDYEYLTHVPSNELGKPSGNAMASVQNVATSSSAAASSP